MPYVITNECINCQACEVECPAEAIERPQDEMFGDENKSIYVSSEHYYIDPEKCDGCLLFSNLRCSNICPMDAIKEI